MQPMKALTRGEFLEIQRQPGIVVHGTKAAHRAFQVNRDIGIYGVPFPDLCFRERTFNSVTPTRAAQSRHALTANLDPNTGDVSIVEEVLAGASRGMVSRLNANHQRQKRGNGKTARAPELAVQTG